MLQKRGNSPHSPTVVTHGQIWPGRVISIGSMGFMVLLFGHVSLSSRSRQDAKTCPTNKQHSCVLLVFISSSDQAVNLVSEIPSSWHRLWRNCNQVVFQLGSNFINVFSPIRFQLQPALDSKYPFLESFMTSVKTRSWPNKTKLTFPVGFPFLIFFSNLSQLLSIHSGVFHYNCEPGPQP